MDSMNAPSQMAGIPLVTPSVRGCKPWGGRS
jgi:hypothetical protein